MTHPAFPTGSIPYKATVQQMRLAICTEGFPENTSSVANEINSLKQFIVCVALQLKINLCRLSLTQIANSSILCAEFMNSVEYNSKYCVAVSDLRIGVVDAFVHLLVCKEILGLES
jgi:hypothetical protein